MNSGLAMIWGNTIVQFGGVTYLTASRMQKGSNVQITPPATGGMGMCGPTPYGTGTVSVAANSTTVTWVSGNQFNSNWVNGGPNANIMEIVGALCNSNGKSDMKCPIASVNSATSITLAVPSTTAATGGIYSVGSPWDSNSNNSGYSCMDSPGRGAGDLLTGNYPNTVNSVRSTQSWPRQVLYPVYVWDNTFTPSDHSPTPIVSALLSLNDNVDYYQQFGPYGESGTFNGTKGVGQGLFSARPLTCTAGTDSATGGSALGVGYWATDTNTLYVCNPTNAWTPFYSPYTYPHPLTTGGTSGASVNPPTGVVATVE
jgi:hypothetical protein